MFEFITKFFQQEPVPESIKTEIRQTVEKSPIVVFSKSYCPYCTQTKETFNKFNPVIIELDQIPDGGFIQRGLQELTGQRTVPNIFINKEHIGGNSDLQNLKKSGELYKLIN